MESTAVRIGETPVTSALDMRAYRTLTLANDLRVLLASDPRSEIAAAALDVGVGSFNDPKDLPGLAHFLEHMLFMGTERYPDENEFAYFLSKHGGSSNAYTAQEHTNYHFQVSTSSARTANCASSDSDTALSSAASEDGEKETPLVSSTGADPTLPMSSKKEVREGGDVLAEALARFSQFFIAPLFTESATDRELTAVDHEHAKNMLNDGRRLGRVGAICGNPQHPRSRFSTGSRETLHDIPTKQGIDVRDALISFHRKYYSANLMHLCITGPQTLDRLQELAVTLFGDIENKHVPLPSLEYATIPPVRDVEMRRVIYAQTVKERREVEISWPLPALRPGFRDAGPGSSSSNCARDLDAAADLVCDLLGYEGAGSLTSYLKELGWIEDLSTGAEYKSHYSMLTCTIDLTMSGVENVDEIVGAVYSYLQLVRGEGVREWIHDEILTIRRNRFRFASRYDPFDLVCGVSACMAFLRDKELLSGHDLDTRYDPSCVRRILDLLTPTRMTLSLSGEFVKEHTNEKEPIYGTAYGVDGISEARLDAWRKPMPNEKLKIRQPNPFIASDFTIVADPLPSGEVMSKEPQRLLDTSKFELHYAPDQTYRQPYAGVGAYFVTSDPVYTSVSSSICVSMAFSLLADDLNELAYDAGEASLSYSVTSSSKGISLGVSGFNEKLDKFFVTILRRLASFRATSDRYHVIKDQYEMGYRNVALRSPMSHAMSQTLEYCEEMSWSSSEYLSALKGDGVSLELVNNFLASLMPVARAVIFVSGNVSVEWALRIPTAIEECLDFEGLSPKGPMQIHVPRVVRLPEGSEIWARQTVPNTEEDNSAIEVLYQVGEHSIEWVETDASLEILVAIMKTPFFDELRTKQQLGYLVSLRLDCWRNVYGISVRIQGKTASPVELRSHIDAFMTSFRDTLRDMADEEFEKFVDAEVAVRSEPDLTFNDFTSRMEFEVFTSRQFLWDRQDREVQALKSASKDSVLSLFDDYILEGSPKRRVFTSCAYGSKHKMSDDDEPIRARGHAVREVSNSSSFKSTCDFHRAQGNLTD